MKKSKLILILLVLSLMLQVFTACNKNEKTPIETEPGVNSTEPAAPQGNIVSDESTDIVSKKDSMTVVVSADPGSLDPHDNVQQQKHQSTRQIYETLVVYNDEGVLIPWLAESWEYEDDLTLVFKIRQGVKFHSGDELTANDVLFSFKRMREDNTPAAMQVNQLNFDKSEVVDEYTVKLVTDEPYALQLPMLELPLCGIISEKTYTENNGDINSNPNGTGPYKVVKFMPGDSLVLEGFEDYWIEGQPYVKNVTLRYISDSSSRAIEAESGGSDIVYDISANDVDRVRENPNLNMVSAMGANTSYLYLNLAQPPLDDARVREAIWYACDMPVAVNVAYRNFGQLADGVVSPGIGGRHPDLSKLFPTRDLEKAKALLEDAGYADGFTTEIVVNANDQQRKDIAEVLQAQLADVGIELKISAMDSTASATYLSEGKAPMTVYGLTASTGEAGRTLFRWLPDTSEWALSSWESEEYNEAISKALVTIDEEERNELYYQCQEMLMENFIVLPVWHKELNAACQPDVKGFRITTSYEHHFLQFVYFD